MGGQLNLKEYLPYRLSVLSNRISRDIARHYQERFGLSTPEWRVMAILGETSGLSATEVAEHTAMDKVAVSRAVATLLGAKIITRKTDAQDKRKAVLALTKKGREIYLQVIPVALAYEAALLEKLPPADRRALDQLLDQLDAIQAGLKLKA